MRYTIDIDENGFTAWRGGHAQKPRRAELIAQSRSGNDLDKLFAEIKQQGYAPGFGPNQEIANAPDPQTGQS